jgi:hypothetical protein
MIVNQLNNPVGTVGDEYSQNCGLIDCKYLEGDGHCRVLAYFQQGLRPRPMVDDMGNPILDEMGRQALFRPTVELSLAETNVMHGDIPLDCSWDLSKA